MSNFKVTVRIETGRSEPAEAPPETGTEEWIDALLREFKLPRSDVKGTRKAWTLLDENTGRMLDPGKSLGANGVRDGHVLYLHVLAAITVVIHIPDNESFSESISPEEKVSELQQKLARRFGLGKANGWRVHDHDLGNFLDANKSLADNSVRTGHHLHLEKTASIPLKLIAGTAAVLALLIIVIVFGLGPSSVSINLTPADASLSATERQQFEASVTGNANTAVQWSRTPEIGDISPDGVYTAPPVVSTPQTVTITVTSQADRNKSASAIVKLAATPVALVEVRPANVSLGISEEITFTATVPNVKWSLTPAIGRISPDGRYAAPPSIGAEQAVIITATSTVDPTRSGSATISLQPVRLTINPAEVQLKASERTSFSATVTGTNNTTVDWSLRGPGRLSQTGEYVAPSSVAAGSTITVRAMSKADPTKIATATVVLSGTSKPSLTQPGETTSGSSGDKVDPKIGKPGFTLDVVSYTLFASQRKKFNAYLNGIQDSSVEWSVQGSGRISKDGTYTAPSPVRQEETIRVTAISKADSSKRATAAVLLKPVGVTVTPQTGEVQAGGRITFRAAVTNTSNLDVKWSVRGPGDISKGVYTAPSSIRDEQTVSVIAESRADSSRSAVATVRLRPYMGKTSGILTWTGIIVQKNVTAAIEGNKASVGTVTGDPLPGVPVRIELENDRDFSIQERPESGNGWQRIVIRSKQNRESTASTVRIIWKLR
jgi:hypothetical protein